MTVKARMLKLLEQRENELISGEAAAAELNCTRAAIWKAVKSLREEGYTIEAGPNKGYVLRGGSRLSEEGIRLYLDHPDVPVKIYRELDSTNRAAKEAAFSGEAGHRCTDTGAQDRKAEEAEEAEVFILLKMQDFI